ncbi:DUF2247 family protein [Enterobacteriaceae bacterium RIT691]|nr:DUF2247 family protein [Enterobacteriaceae bacterium RIT691]
MNLYPIPSNFFDQNTPLSWNDIKWGCDHNLITSDVPIKKAEEKVLSGTYTTVELEMSFLMPKDTSDVAKLLNTICLDDAIEDEKLNRKWVFISLLWLWVNKEKYKNPLDEVEKIYADFDYPIQIESFVQYMPPTDGPHPTQYTGQENIERLLGNWKKYLQMESLTFEFKKLMVDNDFN